jgi:hypothetical protein
MLARRTLLAGMVLVLGACDDGLTAVNENPNAPTDVGAQFLLPQSIRAGVEQVFDAGMMLSHTAIWPQHAVEIQYPDEEEGLVRDSRMQGYWDNFYAGPLADVRLVIEKGAENGNPDIEGVGMIWKSWLFHVVTDSWGDIPYGEALMGAENTTPAYDAQQAVYQGLLADLSAGASKLGGGGANFGSGDLLYDNDMAKWTKFANSLRMRLAMRMSEVDPAGAQAAFVSAYNAGGFTSDADDAVLNWPGSPYRNPLFENWQGRDDHGVSATMVDTLKSLNDPRLELYAEPAQEDGEYRGLQNGDITPEHSISWYSRIGDYWRADGAATPTLVMTYAEVLFLEAEAAARGWIAGDPATLYAQGIRAAMSQYSGAANAPTSAEIEAYLAQPRVQYNAGTGLAQIQLQQWIGLYMNGSEAWAHVRRTNVPALKPGPDLTVSRIPVRFSYPSLEQSLNNTNLQAAVSRQGGGLDLVTSLWWMKN